jgi:hypothetical protein
MGELRKAAIACKDDAKSAADESVQRMPQWNLQV